MAEHKARLEKVLWQDVRESVSQNNSELAAVIDSLDPGPDLHLFKARYPYGFQITHHTNLHLPTPDGRVAPLGDSALDPQLQEELAGNETLLPLSLLLKGSAEIYTQFNDRILPWSLISPGQLMSIWRKLEYKPFYHPVHIFSITSGARSIFMAPNICDTGSHNKLKRDYGINLSPPTSLDEQWHIFRILANHPKVDNDWHNELLLFPRKWLDKIMHDSAWLPLKCYLFEYAWRASAYSRNQVFYNYAFSKALAKRNYKPDPYLNDTVKHIIAIAAGAKPGFKIAVDDQAAPVSLLQKIYLESYGLKKYAPSILYPSYFDCQDSRPVYYSLQHPTTYEFSPKSRKVASTLYNLHEAKSLIDIFLDALIQGKLNVEDTIISCLAEKVCIDYFHNKADCQGEIKLTGELPRDDQSLSHSPVDGREFAESSTFFRGCVRIKHK